MIDKLPEGFMGFLWFSFKGLFVVWCGDFF